MKRLVRKALVVSAFAYALAWITFVSYALVFYGNTSVASVPMWQTAFAISPLAIVMGWLIVVAFWETWGAAWEWAKK